MMIINYIGAFLLIVIGLAVIIFKKNLVKIVIGLGIVDSGVNLIIITIGYRPNGTAPIFTSDISAKSLFVDPVQQALTLTSIVIGACVTALALSLIIKIHQKYNSVNADDVRRLRG